MLPCVKFSTGLDNLSGSFYRTWVAGTIQKNVVNFNGNNRNLRRFGGDPFVRKSALIVDNKSSCFFLLLGAFVATQNSGIEISKQKYAC